MRERSQAPSAEMIVVARRGVSPSPGAIASIRAGLALALGDVPETVTYARRALDLYPRTTISGAERQRRSWGSHPGRAGISRQPTGPMPTAWPICRGPATSPTRSGAQ
jgi:hypothetical protein